MIAEACNPEWVSVPLVGFNTYNAIRNVADVTLLTQIRNRSALLRRMGSDARIEFIDSEAVARPFFQLGRVVTLGRDLGWTAKQAAMWIPYIYFEFLAFRLTRRALARGDFDLIHRVTPLSPTYPSPIAGWTSIPFVLGPINGGLPWPKGSLRTRVLEMEWLSWVRSLYRLMPYVRKTYLRAGCVIAGSRHTLDALPVVARERAVFMPENGIDPVVFSAAGRRSPSSIRPFRVLFVGRLVPYKGADNVLEAFAKSRLREANSEVVIVGDGPEEQKLQAMADRLGIRKSVRFLGRLGQAEIAVWFRESSMFAFPSIREFGGGVVMEAMACGLPCAIVDYGGPSELVTDETGVTVPMAAREVMVSGFTHVLENLYDQPLLLDRYSVASQQLAHRTFTWEGKARAIRNIYQHVAPIDPGEVHE